MLERTCFSEKHATFEMAALFPHLHGKGKSAVISKLACSYIVLALEHVILIFLFDHMWYSLTHYWIYPLLISTLVKKLRKECHDGQISF